MNKPDVTAAQRKITGAIWMRRTIFFHPLAVILALPMMPPEWGLNLATPAKAATFALQPGCTLHGGTWIIQQICGQDGVTPPTQSTISAIEQWETDSITQFLQLYQLSSTPSDVAFVYQYARSDLRTAIRGFMQTRLWAMALEDSSQLTANEVTVLNWFQLRWTYHEANLFKHAAADYQAWVKNPCTWRPDPDIAQAVKLNYIACVGSIATNNAPNANYYLLAARKSEYETLLADLHPLAPNSVYTSSTPVSQKAASVPNPALEESLSTPRTRTQATTPGPSPAGLTLYIGEADQLKANVDTISAVAALAATAAGSVILARNVPILTKFFFPFSYRGGGLQGLHMQEPGVEIEENAPEIETTAANEGDLATAGEAETLAANESTELSAEAEIESETALEAGAESAPETFGIGLVVATVALAVTLAVTFTVTETDAVQQVASQLNSAEEQSFHLDTGLVNMQTLLSSSEGLYKYGVVWTEATYPDVPSQQQLPFPSATTKFINTPSGQTQPVLGGSYTDWSGNAWTMGYYNGYFLNVGAKYVTVGAATQSITYDSITPLIHFTDWSKNQFTAAIVGTNFIVSKRSLGTSDSFCLPSASTGLSSTTNATNCTVQVVNQLQLMDGNGNQATVQIGTAPALNIPSGATYSNVFGSLSETQVTATGIPAPTLSWGGGLAYNNQAETAPGGMGFVASGPGTGFFHCCTDLSNPSQVIPPGSYSAALMATNIVGTTIAPFQFSIGDPNQPLVISQVSGPTGNLILGQNQTWLWQASGAGPYQFYTNITIPGMTFTDNGNGTAQFSGTPSGSTKLCTQDYCGIFVTNANTQTFAPDGNHAFLQFRPTFLSAPSATLAVTSASFPLGQTTSVIITSQGASTPVSYSTPCGLASWLTVADNGNGTATLTGSPGQGQTGAQSFVLQVSALGSAPPANLCGNPNFTASVDSTLNVLSGSSATLPATGGGAFYIQSNGWGGGTVVLDTPLPSGLQFLSIPQAAQGLIHGLPDTGNGGTYYIYYHLTPGPGQGSANYYPPPLFLTITERAQIPIPGNLYMMAGVPQNFVIKPTGYPALGGMTVSILGANPSLPPGLSGSSVTELTTAAGTYTLAGTIPAYAAGFMYTLRFWAQNSIGGDEGDTTIIVVPPGDVNHDMVTNCTDYDFVKSLLNVTSTSPNYNAAADVNSDGVINILDLAFVSANLPKGTVCH